ncbi:MAG: MBL fold metallo-hydrolase, partial [Coriobacteriia bacterium]|nr:MBL fold metallo-hydrolase [Coriobacteriia bacterium]
MESITSHDDGRSIINQLDFTDKQEFDFATRGLIAAPEQLEIRSEDDKVVWTQGAYHFLEDVDATDAPNSVNPSLWRHTQLNYIYGLFEVVPGIYQVRGYDMANITFIKGDTGWVVIDPLMTVETSRAALQLINKHLGERPITGIIYSHTHIDHFGGVKGIITEEEIQQRAIPLVAPQGFEEYAVSENLFAGTAMGRRAGYQYGTMLKPGAEGRMSIGIGMGQSVGTTSYIPPRDGKGDLQDALVRETGDVRVIDGVEMVFQMTPGTEAPAEMNTWFPAHKALWMAENCNATMHNLYTLRGAQVRDGNAWAHCLMESLSLFGDQAQVVFQSHNWPRWGNDVAKEYLLNTAALYKFTNDQSLLYINQGYSAEEIAHKITLPVDLAQLWYLRPYYGTLAHNAKAVYQKYMGWYDG